MSVEDDLLQSFFTEKDVKGLTSQEFQIGMIRLIEQGLVEMVERDGKKLYRPTILAKKIKTHLHSDEKIRN